MAVLACALAAFPLLAAGCGGDGNVPPPEAVDVEPPPPVKAMLEGVSQTGELGSGEMAIRDELEKIKAKDPAKGGALLQDLDQMAKTTDPEQIKSQAKAMADKL